MSNRFAAVDAQHDVVPSQYEPGIPDEEQPAVHMQSFIAAAFDLKGSYWFTEQLSLEFMIPYRLTHVEASFLNSSGDLLPDDFESIHHRDEIVQGIGDVRIGIGYRGDLNDLWAGARYKVKVGLTIPTGSIEPDPFVLGSQKLWHQHLFYGTGTFNPWLSFSFSAPVGPVTIAGWSSCVLPLYRGDHDYRSSKFVLGSLGVSYSLSDSFSVFANQEVFFETPATWGENVARNSGRTDLLFSLGGNWQMTPAFSVAVGVRRPYASFTEGHQLNMPLAGNLELMYDF